MIQRTITRKAEVREVAETLCQLYAQKNEGQFWQVLETDLLAHRVKFPLLEFVAETLFGCLSMEAQLKTITGLWGREADGSSVVAGKLLQLQLPGQPAQTLALAVEGIVKGDTWYHCDHLGERVFGHGLLTQFEVVLPILRDYLRHENSWVRRAVGVAGHYATKKGLPDPEVQTTLALLLTEADSKDYQVQRGIGWGLKTIAKFHPQMVRSALATLPRGTISVPVMGKIRVGLKTAEKQARREG